MSHRLVVIVCLVMIGLTPSAFAEPTSERLPLDVGITLGAASGNLHMDNPPTGISLADYPFSGNPLGVSLNFDLSRKVTLAVELQIVADISNFQITRKGLDGSIAFHLLGGARQTAIDYGHTLEITRDPYNVSLVIRTGFQSYGGGNPNNPSQKFSGAVLGILGGLQFRFDLSDTLALSLEGGFSLINLPFTEERLTAKVNQILASLRFFL